MGDGPVEEAMEEMVVLVAERVEVAEAVEEGGPPPPEGDVIVRPPEGTERD